MEATEGFRAGPTGGLWVLLLLDFTRFASNKKHGAPVVCQALWAGSTGGLSVWPLRPQSLGVVGHLFKLWSLLHLELFSLIQMFDHFSL